MNAMEQLDLNRLLQKASVDGPVYQGLSVQVAAFEHAQTEGDAALGNAFLRQSGNLLLLQRYEAALESRLHRGLDRLRTLQSRRPVVVVDATVGITDADESPAKQASDLEDLIARGVQGLIIGAANPFVANAALARCAAEKIPTVVVELHTTTTGPFHGDEVSTEWWAPSLGLPLRRTITRSLGGEFTYRLTLDLRVASLR